LRADPAVVDFRVRLKATNTKQVQVRKKKKIQLTRSNDSQQQPAAKQAKQTRGGG
jgi:hypothetical protein